MTLVSTLGSCSHHDGFVYDNTTAELYIYAPSDAMKTLNKPKHGSMKNPHPNGVFDRHKIRFKWIYCDETFTNGYKSGCKRGKHGFFRSTDNSSTRRKNNEKAYQPQQVTLEQGEEA